MAKNDALKRLYDEFPKLKKHANFKSIEEFNSWRQQNAPEIPESIWYTYLTPTSSTNSNTGQATLVARSHSTKHTSHAQHGSHAEKAPPHGIEEDKRYQEITKNHIENWNKNNPNTQFKGKIFIKDSTGRLILNPMVDQVIPGIDQNVKSTMRTGFGDAEVDKYKNYEAFRIYKNPSQDPTYQKLLANGSPAEYDRYVNNFYNKASRYSKRNKELKKALKRRDRRIKEQQDIRSQEIKEYKKNPGKDPQIQELKNSIETDTATEYQRQIDEQKQPQAQQNLPQIDREAIRNKIIQMRYEEFFKENPDKAEAYSKKDPVLKKEYESFKKRQKEQAKILSKNQDAQNKTLKALKNNNDVTRDFRIKELEENINAKINQIDPAVRALDPNRITELKEKSYEDFARKNPDLVKKYPNHTELQNAHLRVQNAQKMSQEKSLFKRLQNRIFTKPVQLQPQIPSPIQPPAPPPEKEQQPQQQSKSQPSLRQWRKILQEFNQKPTPQETPLEESAWRGQGFSRVKSYFQSNHAPEGLYRPSEMLQSGKGTTSRPHLKRPRFTRPSLPSAGKAGTNAAEKAGVNAAKQLAANGARSALAALAPYAGIVLLIVVIIIIVLIIVITLILIISGGSDQQNATKISVTKTGPEKVDNGGIIQYKIDVTYSGKADKIILTDPLPENTQLSEAPQGAELKDANGKTTSDLTKVRTVIWTITPAP